MVWDLKNKSPPAFNNSRQRNIFDTISSQLEDISLLRMLIVYLALAILWRE